jgi:hypothetical protein
MNDRQRLEAIVAVVCRYLPPDGISKAEAMSQIIELVDPLPEKDWVGLTDEEIDEIYKQNHNQYGEDTTGEYERELEAKLKERNT